ncbi:hypothetical protein [Nocardia cyriacigeorgica]|uniref:hypothetical protein n=1 Tax=Nocardia cyriacigeorgica TaxID=135487 RepID=UPI003EE2ACEF
MRARMPGKDAELSTTRNVRMGDEPAAPVPGGVLPVAPPIRVWEIVGVGVGGEYNRPRPERRISRQRLIT